MVRTNHVQSRFYKTWATRWNSYQLLRVDVDPVLGLATEVWERCPELDRQLGPEEALRETPGLEEGRGPPGPPEEWTRRTNDAGEAGGEQTPKRGKPAGKPAGKAAAAKQKAKAQAKAKAASRGAQKRPAAARAATK